MTKLTLPWIEKNPEYIFDDSVALGKYLAKSSKPRHTRASILKYELSYSYFGIVRIYGLFGIARFSANLLIRIGSSI
jgi:hypothetical protein